MGTSKRSIDCLNKAIEINPNYTEALINRGLAFLKKNEKYKALNDLESAHRVKPHIKSIWNIILNLKMEFRQFEDTIALLNAMAIVEPMDEKIFERIAICYQILGNFDQAVIAHRKALEINPNFSEAWVNLGTSLKEQDDDESVKAYRSALAIKPDYAEALNNIGTVLARQGNLKEAIEAFNKALSIKPDDPKYWKNLFSPLQALKAQVGFNEDLSYLHPKDSGSNHAKIFAPNFKL